MFKIKRKTNFNLMNFSLFYGKKYFYDNYQNHPWLIYITDMYYCKLTILLTLF